MKRTLPLLLNLFAARALTPLVMLCFLLLYIGIAFFNPEPLVTLVALTRSMLPVGALLALIPVNCAVRLAVAMIRSSRRRTLMRGGGAGMPPAELFDESLPLPGKGDLAGLQARLESFGYRTRLTASSLAAFRGIALAPAKLLFLLAMACLFGGILLSTTCRTTQKVAVIEGEPFTTMPGMAEQVEQISLLDRSGLFLERTVAIKVAGNDGNSRVFGTYPPAFYHGWFVYPRFLGIAPLIRFSAPDFQAGFEMNYVLMIYPPGKEDSAPIPDTDYRIILSIAPPEEGNEPFRSGRMTLLFKIMKGAEAVSSGTLPLGGEFTGDGYRLSVPDFRRVVATDLVRDHGVILIWSAALLFAAALLYWLPVRLFYPRREMLFMAGIDVVQASSRAEGLRRQHGGIFHEALDFLAADEPAARCQEIADKLL